MLIKKMKDLETARVIKLDQLYEVLYQVSTDSISDIQHFWGKKFNDENQGIEEFPEQLVLWQKELEESLEIYFNMCQDDSPESLYENDDTKKWGFRDPDLVQKSANRYCLFFLFLNVFESDI
jgi:hypothetical protein